MERELGYTRPPIPFAEICSHLIKEPFSLSMEDVKKLTPYQVRHVFFRPEKSDPSLRKKIDQLQTMS